MEQNLKMLLFLILIIIFKLSRKIFAKTVNILNNTWQLENVEIYKISQNSSSQKKLEKFEIFFYTFL